jgi:hypothetical protein
MLSATQRQRVAELGPLTGGETVTSAAASFCAASLLEFGWPAPSQVEVEAELKQALKQVPSPR